LPKGRLIFCPSFVLDGQKIFQKEGLFFYESGLPGFHSPRKIASCIIAANKEIK